AYNLTEVSIPYAIEQNIFNAVVYLGYLANSYSHIYDVAIEEVIREPYASRIPEYFDGTKDSDFLQDNLPENLTDLLQASFISDVQNGVLNPFLNYAQKNEMYLWTPQSPLRFYFGSADKDVSPEDSKKAYEYMNANGGNAKLLNLGNFDHDQSILQAIPHVQSWFNKMQ
ncbi:MAG: hypothetical protein AAF599_08165, partial [Bacteroidota bacterium]